MKAIILSCINYKGGVTKTSSAVGLGSALAREGKQVLLVDCDPQGHLSVHLGIDHADLDMSIENVLGSHRVDIRNIILDTDVDNLSIAPSRKGLLHARQELSNRPRRDALLDMALRPVKGDFDYIIIDTPPDEGLLTVNAMYASRYLIVPTPLDRLAMTGIASMMESFAEMRQAYEDRPLDILGLLVNRYDSRQKTENRNNMERLIGRYGDLVFDTRIRVDEEIRRAQREGRTVFQKEGSRCRGAFDYMRLADEVVGRITR